MHFQRDPSFAALWMQDYSGSLTQCWFYGGIITYLIVVVCKDWYEIYLTHIELVDPVSRIGKTLQRAQWPCFWDELLHIIMLTTIILVTGVAMFYTAEVGSMVVNAFAILFLEELDDWAKQWMLGKYRELPRAVAEMWQLSVHTNKEEERDNMLTRAPEKEDNFKALPLFLLWPIACLGYAFLVACWFLAVIWTARGCKPGSMNEVELFG